MSLSSEIADLFASYSEPDEYEVQAQMEFQWHQERASRRESHSFRQRFVYKVRPIAARRAANQNRRDYWRVYRQQERARNPELVARDREASRLRMARKRAEARAA